MDKPAFIMQLRDHLSQSENFMHPFPWKTESIVQSLVGKEGFLVDPYGGIHPFHDGQKWILGGSWSDNKVRRPTHKELGEHFNLTEENNIWWRNIEA